MKQPRKVKLQTFNRYDFWKKLDYIRKMMEAGLTTTTTKQLKSLESRTFFNGTDNHRLAEWNGKNYVKTPERIQWEKDIVKGFDMMQGKA